MTKARMHNSSYPKAAGHCKYEHLRFRQTFVYIDSSVFQAATFGWCKKLATKTILNEL